MRLPIFACAAAGLLASAGTQADLLDRLKRKTDEARASVQQARRDADIAADAEAKIDAAVGQHLPTEAELEQRAEARIEATEPAREARGLERDARGAELEARRLEHEAERVATTDERVAAQLERDIRAAEREAEAALDVEQRARGEIDRSEPAAAAREARREAEEISTADERARGELRRRREELNQAVRFDN